MMRALPLATDSLDVSIPTTTPGQMAIGAAFLVLVALLLLWGLRRKGYWGLRDGLGAVKSHVRATLDGEPAALLQLRARTARELSRDELWERADPLFDEDAGGDHAETDVLGRHSMRGSVARAWGAGRRALATRTRTLPAVVRVPLRWAVLLTVFGVLAVSTESLIRASKADLTPESPIAALQSAGEYLVDAGVKAIDIVALFPFAEGVVTGLFTVGVILADGLYHSWYVVVALLILLAGVLWTLSRDIEDVDEPPLTLHPGSALVLVGSAATGAWGVGVAASKIGAAAGYPGAGDVWGFVGAVLLLAFIAWRFALDDAYRVLAEVHVQTNRAGTVLLFMALRRAGKALSGVAFVLVSVYATVLLIDGRLFDLSGALLAADVGVQGIVLMLLLAVLMGTWWLLRDAWPAIHQSLGGLAAQRAAGFWVGMTALPFVAVVPAYLIASAFTRSVIISAVFAAFVGFLVRRVSGWGVQMMDAVDLREMMRPPAPIWVTTRAWVLDPPGADRQFYAEVNGHAVCHTDREKAMAAVVDAIEAKADPDPIKPSEPRQQTPVPSVASWHARFLTRFGIHDVDETQAKLEERVRAKTVTLLRKRDSECSRKELDWQVESFPEDIARERWNEMTPWVIVDDDRAVMCEDVWADRTDDPYGTTFSVRGD